MSTPRIAQLSAGDVDGRRVVRNTITLMVLRIGLPMLSVGLVSFVAHTLGSEALGRYTLGLSFLFIVTTITPLGLQALLTRDGARDPAALSAILANASTLVTIASLIATALMAVAIRLLDYDPPTERAVLLCCAGVLPFTIATVQEAAIVALERIGWMAWAALAENVIKVGGGLYAVATGGGIESVIILALAGRVAACLVMGFLLRQHGVRLSLGSHGPTLAYLRRSAPTFVLISLFATLYWRIDIMMLSHLRSVAEVGVYGGAYRLLELAMVIPQSLCLAVYPQLARLTGPATPTRADLGRTTLRYLMALTVPIAVAATLLAEPIMALLYGVEFRAGASTLRVLVWTLVPYCWVRYHAYVLLSADRQDVDLKLNVAMSVVCVALNAALVPGWGPFGAAIATLVSITIYGIGQYAFLRARLPGHVADVTGIWTPVAAGAVMWLGAGLISPERVSAAALVAAVCYVITLTALGFFGAADLRVIGLSRLAESRWLR